MTSAIFEAYFLFLVIFEKLRCWGTLFLNKHNYIIWEAKAGQFKVSPSEPFHAHKRARPE